MKISSINTLTFNPYTKQNITPKQEISNTSNQQQHEEYLTNLGNTNAALINFNGGASLNLSATIKNLRALGSNLERSIFPPRVEGDAAKLIETGNPRNLKLVDVHKNIFSKIKGCNSLEEIKELFREEKLFDDVVSAYDVEFAPGSFADKVLSGESEYFSKDEDLSMQLIKLYWGDGFSLTDLKTYTDGKDVNYLLNKLNIPKRNAHYGYYLKLSDEEYNNRITAEMTRKRFETLDRKLAESEGEPLYIPRGPMSEEHKRHISEGLIKYYQENPLACYNISKRQREFYEKHPEQKLIFKEVLKRAWGLKSAEGIKKALKKFFAQAGEKNESLEFLTDPLSANAKQSQLMKRFWALNDWARKSHSKNMQYGWKTVKHDLENPEILFNYPMGLVTDIIEYAKKKGVTLEMEDFITSYEKITNRHIYNPKFFKIFTEFVDESNNADLIASLYQYSLIKGIQNLAREATPENIKERRKILDFLTKKYQDKIYDLDPVSQRVIRYKDLNIDQARTLFINVQMDLRRFDPELEENFLAQLTLDYPKVKEEALKARKE